MAPSGPRPWLLSDALLAPVAEGRVQLEQDWIANIPRLLFAIVFFVFGLISFAAWLGGRERRELLWFSFVSLSQAVASCYAMLALLLDLRPFNSAGVAHPDLFLVSLQFLLFGEFAMAVLGNASVSRRIALCLGWAPLPVIVFLTRYSPDAVFLPIVWCCLFVAAVALWDLRGLRPEYRARQEKILRAVLVIRAVDSGMSFVRSSQGMSPVANFTVSVGPFLVTREDLSWMLISAVIFVILFRRQAADRREKQRLGGELEAARIVQQLLLNNSESESIEAVYYPAQEVGGDFYQIFRLEDGSELLAVGDVSGKGLRAAMVVSLITGALRNRKSDEPGALLTELNRALAGSLNGGFVTAAAARCYPDGKVVVANAGNPAPYLGGEEVHVEAGLPLGILRDTEYPESECCLRVGQQILFISDGVVEAANAKGELFGFERTREISGKRAGELAAAAQAWGQNDDITVVTVGRSIG